MAVPNYPKLYTDGHGLALTKLYVQKPSGSRWVTTRIYEMGKRFRLRMRFTNFFKAGVPQLGRAFGATGIYIAEINVNLTLRGARFSNGRTSKRFIFLPASGNGFPDSLAPEKSRYFEADFQWMLPPANVAEWPIELYTTHRQVIYMPPAKKTSLRI